MTVTLAWSDIGMPSDQHNIYFLAYVHRSNSRGTFLQPFTKVP